MEIVGATLAEAHALLAEAGYERARVDDEGDQLDRGVAEESACSYCGHSGLGYENWTRLEPRSRRALATCPECGKCDEF